MTEAKTYIAPSLRQPDNHAVMLIDYQYLQLTAARSHDPQAAIGAAVVLARAAKSFTVPTLLIVGMAKRQGLVHEVAAVFSEETPIDRTTLNSFEDKRVVEWVSRSRASSISLDSGETSNNLTATGLLMEGLNQVDLSTEERYERYKAPRDVVRSTFQHNFDLTFI
jgi:hypothetical protein